MAPSILNDVIQQVADKLAARGNTVPLTPTILAQARQLCRVLQTRVAIGKLGTADRAERRAAVALEYAVRQSGSQQRLSLKDLAACTGIKKVAVFSNLHHMIGNYLQQQPAASRRAAATAKTAVPNYRTSNNGRVRDLTTAAVHSNKRRKLRSDEDSISKRKSSIPDLALRLATHCVDPHGMGRRAVVLLKQIEAHVEQLPVHERRGHVYDLTRYRAAYEAACFFYIATKSRDAVNDSSQTAADRPLLELLDLVQVSTEFTFLQIQQVWPHVLELAKQLDKVSTSTANKKQPVKRQRGVQKTMAIASNNKQSKKQVVHEKDDTLNEDGAADLDVVDDDNVAFQEDEDDTVSFSEWKNQMLAQALEQAQRDLVAETDKDADFSRGQALERAADTVLQKYGLLSAATASVVIAVL